MILVGLSSMVTKAYAANQKLMEYVIVRSNTPMAMLITFAALSVGVSAQQPKLAKGL